MFFFDLSKLALPRALLKVSLCYFTVIKRDASRHRESCAWQIIQSSEFTVIVEPYGARRRRTRFLKDQLDRADAASWQIADGSDLRTARALAGPRTVRISRRAPTW